MRREVYVEKRAQRKDRWFKKQERQRERQREGMEYDDCTKKRVFGWGCETDILLERERVMI